MNTVEPDAKPLDPCPNGCGPLVKDREVAWYRLECVACRYSYNWVPVAVRAPRTPEQNGGERA
jgi:hypothetical protein